MEVYILIDDDGDGFSIEEISTSLEALVEKPYYSMKRKIYKINLDNHPTVDIEYLFNSEPVYGENFIHKEF